MERTHRLIIRYRGFLEGSSHDLAKIQDLMRGHDMQSAISRHFMEHKYALSEVLSLLFFLFFSPSSFFYFLSRSGIICSREWSRIVSLPDSSDLNRQWNQINPHRLLIQCDRQLHSNYACRLLPNRLKGESVGEWGRILNPLRNTFSILGKFSSDKIYYN